jgi:adenine phosphoribosyltransferase
MDLKKWIRDIPDFPVKGVIFKDITPLLKDPEAFRFCVDQMVDSLSSVSFQTIVSPEARGFMFASAISYLMKKSFIPVRKPGKLPYKTRSVGYSLEYGNAELHIHEDAIQQGERVVVLDDVLATGGTVKAIASMVEEMGGIVEGVFFLAELDFLNGRERLQSYPVHSLIRYS